MATKQFTREQKHFFDTRYDIKTPAEAIAHLRRLIQQKQNAIRDYANLHRELREFGISVPSDLPFQIGG